MTAVLSVIGTGTSAQVVLGMLISFLYICLYGYCKPYMESQHSVLATFGQSQIFFTFFGALIIQNNLLGSDWNSTVGVFLVIMNLGVIFLSFQGEIDDYLSNKEEERKLKQKLDC